MTTGVVEIPLTRGAVVTIDVADLALIGNHKWMLALNGCGHRYARRSVRDVLGRVRWVYMHRVIVAALPNQHVDHRDGDGLNNRRSNLRACSPAENRRNIRSIGAASGYKGVYYDPVDRGPRVWKVKLEAHGQYVHVGRFITREEAARAYDEAARRYHGEFAATNAELRP